MGKLLFIGVTCADVIINVDRLPQTAQDVVVYGQKMALGGCAFNAFAIAHALEVPSLLFSPVGSGAFGDFVRHGLEAEGVEVMVANPERENGCCYCFVEPDGERTFVAYHGADYFYKAEWFDAIDMDDVDMIYVCGLEIEEETGDVIVDFLERRAADKTIVFTPGPRPAELPMDRVERIYDLHPILHMNGDEAVVSAARLRGANDSNPGDVALHEAVCCLRERVHNTVIATLGANGCYFDTGEETGTVAGVPARVVDTIGAGDAHVGAVMACLQRGDALRDALACANRISSAVVSTAGAHMEAPAICLAAGR